MLLSSDVAYLSQFEHLGSECWEPALRTGGEVVPHHVIPGGHAVGEGTLAGGAVKLGLKDFRGAVGAGGEVGLRLTAGLAFGRRPPNNAWREVQF